MIIYKITNKINGKSYIGQTIKTVEERWKNHRSKSSGCRALSSAIKKYGKDSFEIEIIDSAHNLEELNKKEEFYIEKHNSIAPNGYNLKTGGDQPRLCKESAKKISESNKGTKAWNKGLTKEDPRVRSYSKYGKDNYWYGKVGHRKGKKHTDEAKKKLSEAHKGKKLSEEHKRNIAISIRKSMYKIEKPIMCMETQVVYKSLTEAARILNLSIGNVCNVLKGKRKSTGNYTFTYKDKINGNQRT